MQNSSVITVASSLACLELRCHIKVMREKELRLALICYGGVSLAIYMHGVTREIWHLIRASRAYHDGDDTLGKS